MSEELFFNELCFQFPEFFMLLSNQFSCLMELNHDGVAEEETTGASTLHYLILRDNTSLFTLPLVCLKGVHYIQFSLACFFLGTLFIYFIYFYQLEANYLQYCSGFCHTLT